MRAANSLSDAQSMVNNKWSFSTTSQGVWIRIVICEFHEVFATMNRFKIRTEIWTFQMFRLHSTYSMPLQRVISTTVHLSPHPVRLISDWSFSERFSFSNDFLPDSLSDSTRLLSIDFRMKSCFRVISEPFDSILMNFFLASCSSIHLYSYRRL